MKVRKEQYDVWMPNLGPSERLRNKFASGKITWAQFRQTYRAELFHSPDVDRGNERIRNYGQKFTLRLIQRLDQTGNVTILCHCSEDQKHCHRHVLKQVLDGKI